MRRTGAGPPLTRDEALAEERAHLLPGRPPGAPLAALCLSGGGIRSATFALGVLEGLARFELLGHFHYLSTVSGGGYVGSWLTAWRTHAQDDRAVFAALDRTRSLDGSEATQVQGLRADSNYLTPKLGVLSADTWAAAALVLRNLALNWLVFGPLFLGVLFAPKLLASGLALLGPGSGAAPAAWAPGAWAPFAWMPGAWTPFAWMPFAWTLAGAAAAVAGLATAVRSRLQQAGDWLGDGRFLRFVGLPMAAAAIALTFGADAWPQAALPAAAMGGVAGAVCYALAWCVGFGWWRAAASQADRSRAGVVWLADLLACLAAGLAAGLSLAAGAHGRALLAPGPAALLVFGPAWALLSFALADIAFVGLNSFAARGEQDREWLARYGGWLLAAAATFGAACAVDLYLPDAISWSWGRATAYGATLGVSGAVTLLLGPSRFTGATTSRKAAEPLKLSSLVSVAALVFAACLAAALSALDDRIVCAVAGGAPSPDSACALDPGRAAPWQFAGLAAFACLAFAASWFVNVNRFSLHALYRNRLVRAFLGSAQRGAGQAAPLTRSAASIPTTICAWHRRCRRPRTGARLFHVVNMTLNVVATENLAWQERKAEPFAVTALHAGNRPLGYRPTALYGGPDGGITLGTAMAISGAAVSPNSGYHSSPLVGMLLSLFNLRLGWWLGNPRREPRSRREGPAPALVPALEELAGQTDDRGKWVYLSDGGHFDNLGLYEMVAPRLPQDRGQRRGLRPGQRLRGPRQCRAQDLHRHGRQHRLRDAGDPAPRTARPTPASTAPWARSAIRATPTTAGCSTSSPAIAARNRPMCAAMRSPTGPFRTNRPPNSGSPSRSSRPTARSGPTSRS